MSTAQADSTAQSDEPSEVKRPVSFDLIAVGNTKIDVFFSFYEDPAKWRVTPRTKELALKLGEKVSVDRTDYSMGGNASNVAVGLSRLGYSAALMAEIGDDAFADDIEKNLRAEGVNRQLIVRTPGSRTSLGVIMNVDEDRTILSQHVARSHPFSFDGAATRLLYLTSIGNAWEHVYQKTLDFSIANKVPIAFNPGTLQLREQPEVFWQVIKHSHILCVNKEEGLKILVGAHSKALKKDVESTSMESILAGLADLGPKIVVVTNGKDGSHARAEDGRIFHQETIPAVVVERTGAGDAFTSGLLGAALAGKSLQEAMLWGTRNSAAVIGKIGAQAGLLTRDQMESNIMDMRLIDLGYTDPLIILPFDHRSVFAKYLFEVDASKVTKEQQAAVRDFKALIYQGVKRSLDMGVPKGSEAILADEETGAEVLKQAIDDGVTTILTVEKSDQKELAFEYGSQYHQHIDKFKPTFTKVLVSYNMADSAESRKRQQAKLKEISDYSHERGYKFLLEMLVKPTEEQLRKAGGSQEDFDKNLKTDVVVEIIAELQEAGVEPDVWNLEGLESTDDYKRLIKAIRTNGRENVSLVVLGRGASVEKVDQWLDLSAGLTGVIGFAVGRTVFWDAVSNYYHKKISREEAINQIATNFSHFYQTFSQKEASFNSSVLPPAGAATEVAEPESAAAAKEWVAETVAEATAVKEEEVVEDGEGEAVLVEQPESSEPSEPSDPSEHSDSAELPVSAATEAVEAESAPIEHGFPTETETVVRTSTDDDDDDDGMPSWAVQRPVAEPSAADDELSFSGDQSTATEVTGGVDLGISPRPVVGGFAVEPSFEPEDMAEELGDNAVEQKKGLFGKLFKKS